MAESTLESKSILVSFMGRKKVVKLQESASVKTAIEEVKKVFSLSSEVEVALERFDQEWNEFVELEIEDSIHHKDKMKAIIVSTDESPCSSVSVLTS